METILFIGSNTSNASADNSAFHPSTKSRKILDSWCQDIVGIKAYLNVLDKKTEDNRPLTQEEIKVNISRLAEDIKKINPDKIIALGKTASKAVSLLGLKFLELPHPSGMNRLLNDPQYVEEKIKELVEFCSTSSDIESVKSSD
jgi:uracil-DNA glycosylase